MRLRVLPELLEHREQAVDESVEVGDDVGVQVVDDVYRELRGDAFVLFDLGELLGLHFAHEQLALHEVVVAGQLAQLLLDAPLLLLDECLQLAPHLLHHHVQEGALLEAVGLDVVFEVLGVVELLLQLLAPLGQDPQGLRVFNFEAVRGDLVLSEESGGLGHLLADLVVGVLPDFVLVAGLFAFLELVVLALE